MAVIGTKVHCKNNFSWKVRSTRIDDVEKLLEFIPLLDSETKFMLRSPDEFQMTLIEEIEYINRKIDGEKDLFLVAEVKDNIVGIINFTGSNLKYYKHQGKFAMGVIKEFWGNGIGSSLIEEMINWCDKNEILRITLEVLETNILAINLYKKFSFEVEGILRKDSYHGNGKYLDSFIMARLSNKLI